MLEKIESNRYPAHSTRKKILRAIMNIYKDKPKQAWKNWREVKTGKEIYSEDKVLHNHILMRTDPRGKGPILIHAGGIAGYSTNPSITSSFMEEDAEGSTMFGENVSVHFEPQWLHNGKPFFTLTQKILYYGNESASPFSYFVPDVISGVRLREGALEFMPSYHGGAFLLNSPYRFPLENRGWVEKNVLPEESSWFYEFHRFEMDIIFNNAVSVIAGAGRRFFNQQVRSRWEADVTGISPLLRTDKFKASGAFSIRAYKARRATYDLIGATSLFSMQYMPNKGRLSISSSLLLSKDRYPNDQKNRNDILINVLPGIWYRYKDLKFGISCEYGRRYSNVDEYGYADMRIQAKIDISMKLYPSALKTVNPPNHVALPYGLHTEEIIGRDDSIRELLEQREDMQRSSSCLE
jgi:hypothetical protein